MAKLTFRKASGKDELEDVFRLRYKVYCEERGYEKPEEHPGGLEFDEFDDHAVHFVVLNSRNRIIGTVRVILDSSDGFPIEKHCSIDADLSQVDRHRVGEISRLAVSKDYRRRASDRFIYDGASDDPPSDAVPVDRDRRRRNEIVIGLYKCLYIESKKRGLNFWFTAMSRGLFLLLGRMGVEFKPIGPHINYHGFRAPYLGNIREIERHVLKSNPVFFKEMNDGVMSS